MSQPDTSCVVVLVHATRSSLPCCQHLVIRYSFIPQCLKSPFHYPHLSAGANMNDPGLHESANEAAQDVEKNEKEGVEQAEQDEQEFLDPRYVG